MPRTSHLYVVSPSSRPGPAHATAPWQCRFPPPARIRRHRRIGSGIDHDDRPVDLARNCSATSHRPRDDRFGMTRAMTLDMGKRFIETVNHLAPRARRQDIRRPSPRRSPARCADPAHAPRIAAQLATGIDQPAPPRPCGCGKRASSSSVSIDPQIRRRILALSAIARAISGSRTRGHRCGRSPRDGRAPAPAHRPARGRPGSCRRAARSRRSCLQPASIGRPQHGPWSAPAGWPQREARGAQSLDQQAESQCSNDRLAAAAQDRRIGRPQAQRAGIGGHVRTALVNDADHTERHAHALDPQAVGPRPLGQHVPMGSGSAAISSTPRAIPAMRAASSCSRSSAALPGPPRSPQRMSHSLAARIPDCRARAPRPSPAGPSCAARRWRARARAAPRRLRGPGAAIVAVSAVVSFNSAPGRRGGSFRRDHDTREWPRAPGCAGRRCGGPPRSNRR